LNISSIQIFSSWWLNSTSAWSSRG